MLGDDIMDGTKRGVAIVAHAAKNVIKGAVLFAAVAASAVMLWEVGAVFLGAAVPGVYGFTGLASAIGAAFGASTTGAAAAAGAALTDAASAAVGYGATAGIVGGAVTGAASLFPGKDEGFSFRRSYRKLEEMGKGRGKDRAVEQETSAARDAVYSAPAPAYIPAPQAQPIIVQSPQAAPAPQAQPIIVHAQQPAQQQPIVIVQQPAPQAQPQTVIQQVDAPAPQQLDAPLPPQAAQPQTQEVASTGDNPYFRPGKGVELMQRGNATESTISK